MNKASYYAGAARQPTNTAAKFWNVVDVSESEGEITLYGDVVSKHPVDWWTGEPKPGLYISPEGFMEDLDTIRNKQKVTVKLNSCGGDLYTGIAIHNALKQLPGTVNVIVEGIAASAASVIMCAGDTVTVHPGSLIMIHGVSVLLYDSVTIQDMKRLMKGMDASEKAIAAIYNAKTGIEVDTLRGMMTKETWFTGAEAVEKGFADELDDDDETQMSMSADKQVLFVNGIEHIVGAFHNIPGGIPVRAAAKPARPEAKIKPPEAAEHEGGKQTMTLDELRAQEPELVAQIEDNAKNAAREAAAAEERERIAEIDSIADTIPDKKLVDEAKYGDSRCTAQELSFRVLKQSAAQGKQFLADYTADGKDSGANDVGSAPNGGGDATKEQDAADLAAVISAYKQSKGGTN